MADDGWLEERREFMRALEKEAGVLRQRAQEAEHTLNESGEGLQGDIVDQPSEAENEEDARRLRWIAQNCGRAAAGADNLTEQLREVISGFESEQDDG
jgi:hypothetical protein